MSADVRSRRLERMLDDPDLIGDLLLVGLCFARLLDFGGLKPGEKMNTRHVARAAFGPGKLAQRQVQGVLADDARRYKPPALTWQTKLCGAPMSRRDGVCGRSSSWTRMLTDWSTGEQSWLLACSRHVQWYDDVARENRDTQPKRLVRPAANHGGVLARHIPEFGWPKIWHWATNGRWIEPPERTPWAPPTLTLHLGDGEVSPAAPQPRLVPVSAS